MTIWDYQNVVSRRLLVWGVLSAVVGTALVVSGGLFGRAFGIQALAWGAVNAAIALLSGFTARRKRAALLNPWTAEIQVRRTRTLRRVLWANTLLDVGYMAGGLILALTMGGRSATWRGHGWGIVAQGAFLFLFDLLHARGVPDAEDSPPL
jgi:hypothetical protein